MQSASTASTSVEPSSQHSQPRGNSRRRNAQGNGGRGRRRRQRGGARNRAPESNRGLGQQLNGAYSTSEAPVEGQSGVFELYSLSMQNALPPATSRTSHTAAGARAKPRRRSPRANPKETPTDLTRSLITALNRGTHDCMICLSSIHRRQPKWSCDTCHTIIHLSCMRKWSRQPQDQIEQQSQSIPKHATCPSCRAEHPAPKNICFCKKRESPAVEPGVTPGSCGDICSKPLGEDGSGCMHTCSALCHPGPCAPCGGGSLEESCFCGTDSVMRRCGIVRRGFSCGGTCGKELPCGHTCLRVCHADACGECEVMNSTACYCGKEKVDVPCGVTDVCCGAVCGKPLECGKHVCQAVCHPGSCGECKLAPQAVDRCACGATALDDDVRWGRTCEDPVPGCGGVCGKGLGCVSNCRCEDACGHESACHRCDKQISMECRCGGSVIDVICGTDVEDLKNQLVCNRKCNDKLVCRRHHCQVICCPYKKRRAMKRKNVELSSLLWGSEMGISNSERKRLGHKCNELCEKVLSCGKHECDLSCGHSGDCPPCGILLREDLSCACGARVLRSPVRCGTPAPTCENMCRRVRECGHACPNFCHTDDCPICVQVVKVDCVGKHGEGRFVQCHIAQKGIRCHRACGRPLQCGVHACRSACHGDWPASCERSSENGCDQPCGLPRKKCGHSCMNSCHPGMFCPEVPCKENIIATCPCGRRREDALCLKGGYGSGQNSEEESGNEIRLSCDDECASQTRLRAFASAVGKNDSTHGVLDVVDEEGHVTYSSFLLRFAETEPDMLAHFEQQLASIVECKVRKVALGGLPQLHRLVLHTLAEMYNLDSESAGRAGDRKLSIRHRGVGLKPKFPKPLLSEAFAIRELDKKRSKQLQAGRVLHIHVASSTKYGGTMDSATRVERELKEHAGSFRIIRKATLSCNLIGVAVEFSTPERASLVLSSMTSRPGVTVEGAATSARLDRLPSESEPTPWENTRKLNESSWNDDVSFGSRFRGMRQSLPQRPCTELIVDEDNVPDSWDD